MLLLRGSRYESHVHLYLTCLRVCVLVTLHLIHRYREHSVISPLGQFTILIHHQIFSWWDRIHFESPPRECDKFSSGVRSPKYGFFLHHTLISSMCSRSVRICGEQWLSSKGLAGAQECDSLWETLIVDLLCVWLVGGFCGLGITDRYSRIFPSHPFFGFLAVGRARLSRSPAFLFFLRSPCLNGNQQAVDKTSVPHKETHGPSKNSSSR